MSSMYRTLPNTQGGSFWCRYCQAYFFYKPEYGTVKELRKAKIKHYGQFHRKVKEVNWRAHICEKCKESFVSRNELQNHKYEEHGY